jgi:hypothetical protein
VKSSQIRFFDSNYSRYPLLSFIFAFEMKSFSGKIIVRLSIAAAFAASLPFWHIERVDFNTQIRPILNKSCLPCHGGVKQQGNLSFISREEALRPARSGKRAIVPGNPEASELVSRIEHHDPEMRMPYQKEALAPEEISLIRRWIREGAAWDLHWAFKPVDSPVIPESGKKWWEFWREDPNKSISNLDRFVMERLKNEELTLSPEADKRTLGQRVSMDLTGLPLPPALESVYLGDTSALAYERLVDTLLASPRYGERWTALWLDLARYADTKGYERDARRSVWRYRDWLIRAFNQDMPYDQFVTEQLAGDLLPEPTDYQYVATAFHRNTMTNDEGGTNNEEFRVAAVIDRVNTTWTSLMGTTFACVQCHGHPYEPFYMTDYYRFMAFFNNSRDEDTWEDYPALRHLSATDSLSLLKFSGQLSERLSPEKAAEIKQFIKTWQPAYYSIAADSFLNCELYDTKWLTMRSHARARLRDVSLDGKSRLIWRYTANTATGQLTVHIDRPDGPVLFETSVGKTAGREIHSIDFQPVEGRHNLWFLYENSSLNTEGASDLMFDWLHFGTPLPGEETEQGIALRDTFFRLLRAPSDFTPVMVEASAEIARPTRIFQRGSWLSPTDTVQPGVPAFMHQMPEDVPANRLGLARWITDKRNPLTARTLVNRLWEQLFGLGLAETLEDLGSQGARPAHPELLDYLSWRLMNDYNWSIKKLLREIVLSATYRQDSRITPALLERDPRNELLARGPRVRLTAEQIRDKSLAAAGLLSSKMYGPGVMPRQPDGIWSSPWSGDYWQTSTGEDQYRRAIYTFVKRTSPYPGAVSFDMAPREVCSARRIRTNTPLQALVTLNDPVFMEAAEVMAASVQEQCSGAPEQQIAVLYERAIGKPVTAATGAIMLKLYNRAAAEPGSRPPLVVVANAVMNLDEFLVKG